MWQPIETAPKTGETLEFKNEQSGKTDVGYWDDYTHREFREIDGEWNTEHGEGDMTHWRYPSQPEQ